MNRLFTKKEILICGKKKLYINCFTKRFAAKEALVKALGTGFRKNINFKDIEIKIFGVTVLTSLSDEDTNYIFRREAQDQVKAMLDLAEEARIDGIVCSPHELHLVTPRSSLLSITPGIRFTSSDDDQRRIMTPKQAIELGADFIVIGRPITESNNISKSLNDLSEQIK